MISVVMGVFNGAAFLGEAIESVLGQSFREFEFIIVDDGSTDASSEIIAAFASSDSRIVSMRQENRGLPAALNAGIRRARYDLIARMDADDRMLPQRLDRQLAFMLERPHLTVASSYSYLINTKGRRIASSKTKVDTKRGLAERNPGLFLEVIHPSVLMKKEHILQLGGYRESLLYAEDRDLWGRVVTSGGQIECQPEFLLEYRLHAQSMTMRKAIRNRIICQAINFNVVRRMNGEAELSDEEVFRIYSALPFLHRLKDRLNFTSLYSFKNASRYYAESQYLKCGYWFAKAVACCPRMILRRTVARLS
jgi:glycosyltransferase involved in cell wall biosynthesis